MTPASDQPQPLAPQARSVVVCSGHMIDAPGRTPPRFPLERESTVAGFMRYTAVRWCLGPGDLVMTGGAQGSDILFSEIARERGATVRLMIPLPEREFLDRSVRSPGPGDWERRYRLLREVCQTRFLHEAAVARDPLVPLEEPALNVFARNNRWMLRSAVAESSRGPVPSTLRAVLVWDESPSGGKPGGTGDFAAEIRRAGSEVVIINPTTLRRTLIPAEISL